MFHFESSRALQIGLLCAHKVLRQMAKCLLSGRVSHVISGMDGGEPSCRFRIGSVPCIARRELALQIIEHKSYAEHEVSVTGELVGDGKKKVLDISELNVVC